MYNKLVATSDEISCTNCDNSSRSSGWFEILGLKNVFCGLKNI